MNPKLHPGDRSAERADELLARLERLEQASSTTLTILSGREEPEWGARLEQMRLDALLHTHQIRRARERLARELGRSHEPPASAKMGPVPPRSTPETLLGMTQRAVVAYEDALERLVGPAALRGMVTSCLADHRIHRRALEEEVERRRGDALDPNAR